VNAVAQTKTIVRQEFGPLPTCTFALQNDLTTAYNYQDMWWAAPAGSQAGWGIDLAHQGDVIFATWFTYDHDGSPLWLSFTAQKTATGTYAGRSIEHRGRRSTRRPSIPVKSLQRASARPSLLSRTATPGRSRGRSTA